MTKNIKTMSYEEIKAANGPHCASCLKPGTFKNCGCGFADVLQCSTESSCPDCERLHTDIGIFTRRLLDAKLTLRSNSLRAKLFGAFHAGIVALRDEARDEERQQDLRTFGYALECLRNTGPFTTDEAKFRANILEAVRCVRKSPKLAASIQDALQESEIAVLAVRFIDKLKPENSAGASAFLASIAQTTPQQRRAARRLRHLDESESFYR